MRFILNFFSLVADMKNQIKSAGGSKGKILFVSADSKRRIRLLQELDEGLELVFHDSFTLSVNVMCQEMVGKTCKHCGNDDLRTRKLYAFRVYDYESKEQKIMLYAANSFSPLPHFISFSETYGTITDKDYVISRAGKGKNTVYTVIPMDKAKFRQKLKAPTEQQLLKVINKAHPDNNDQVDDLDNSASNLTEADEVNYDSMDAVTLYKMCVARGIKVEKRKEAEFYADELYNATEVDEWGEDEPGEKEQTIDEWADANNDTTSSDGVDW